MSPAALIAAAVAGAEMLPMTGARPATSSATVSMTRRHAAALRAANSPVVPAAQIPCTPLSSRKFTSRRSDPASTAPAGVSGVRIGTITPRSAAPVGSLVWVMWVAPLRVRSLHHPHHGRQSQRRGTRGNGGVRVVRCAETQSAMNIVLFDSDAGQFSEHIRCVTPEAMTAGARAAPAEPCIRIGLPLTDHRARHLLEVLRCQPGSRFRAGVVNGPSGVGTIVAIGQDRMHIELTSTTEPVQPTDISLIVGLPRPPSAAKILYQGTAIGCRAIHFVHTELSDRNYAKSRLWQRAEWRRHLLDGAQQAAATTVPEVTCGAPLPGVLRRLAGGAETVALDHEVGARRLGAVRLQAPLVLAVGPERGWSEQDRDTLARCHFTFCTLGARILRVETACVAALAVAKAQLGDM